jgi:hypothetical protein
LCFSFGLGQSAKRTAFINARAIKRKRGVYSSRFRLSFVAYPAGRCNSDGPFRGNLAVPCWYSRLYRVARVVWPHLPQKCYCPGPLQAASCRLQAAGCMPVPVPAILPRGCWLRCWWARLERRESWYAVRLRFACCPCLIRDSIRPASDTAPRASPPSALCALRATESESEFLSPFAFPPPRPEHSANSRGGELPRHEGPWLSMSTLIII